MSGRLGDPGNRADTSGTIGRCVWIACSILAAMMILSWPAAVNRGPFFIADTSAYIRGADAAFTTTFGYQSPWSDRIDQYRPGTQAPANKAPVDDHLSKPVAPRLPLAGRSIYYGAFLYAPVVFVQEYAAVLLQSILSAIVLWLAMVPLTGGFSLKRRCLAFLGTSAALALLTPLPFVNSLVMPDYLTGLSLTSLVILMCFWQSYTSIARLFLVGVIFLAAVSHSSNLPMILAVTAVGVVLQLFRQNLARQAIAIGLIAVAAGFAGEWIFAEIVQQELGVRPVRPPFLTARLIADGPGHHMMQERCKEGEFVVCKYMDRTPADSDAFLWDRGGKIGVFSAASIADQRLLSQQDTAFALATVRQFPGETLAAMSGSFLRQITLFKYAIWRGSAVRSFVDWSNLPPEVEGRMRNTRSAHGTMPTQPFQTIAIVVAFLTIPIALLGLIVAYRSRDTRLAPFANALFLVAAGVLANAAVTGCLSKPDSRYNLRVVWVLPLFAAGLCSAEIMRRNRKRI